MINVQAPKHREIYLKTTAGSCFYLAPGERRQLPNFVMEIAQREGCEVTPIADAPAADAPDRLALLERAVRTLIEEGNPEHFTKDKERRPRVAAVRALVDSEFTGEELSAVHQAVIDDLRD